MLSTRTLGPAKRQTRRIEWQVEILAGNGGKVPGPAGKKSCVTGTEPILFACDVIYMYLFVPQPSVNRLEVVTAQLDMLATADRAAPDDSVLGSPDKTSYSHFWWIPFLKGLFQEIRHRAFRLVWACLIHLSSFLTFLMFLLVVLKGPTPPLPVFVAWPVLLFLLLFCVFFSDLLFDSD